MCSLFKILYCLKGIVNPKILFKFCHNLLTLIRSPLRDIVVGKIRGEWKKIQGGRKKYFSNVLRSLAKLLRSLAKLLRSLEKLCVLSQNFCVLSQRYLRSLAKLKKKKIFTRESKSFARERKYLCERTQKFCERTQSFSRERKSFARERKTFEKYFFLTPWIFSTHSDFFPPQCPLKGSVPSCHSEPVYVSFLCWTQKKISEEFWRTKQMLVLNDFFSRERNTMEVNGDHQLFDYQYSSKYLHNSYRFGTKWGWVKDDNIFIFGWTIPLRNNFFRHW